MWVLLEKHARTPRQTGHIEPAVGCEIINVWETKQTIDEKQWWATGTTNLCDRKMA